MATEIKVIHTADSHYQAGELRTLLVNESMREPEVGWNPLIRTKFNELMEALVQSAFDAGRDFERKHPNLK